MMDGLVELITGIAVGGGVVGVVARFALRAVADRLIRRFEEMERDLKAIKEKQIASLDERLDETEESIEDIRIGCKGAANLERIIALEKRAERAEFQTGELGRKMEGVQVTLTNQASAFRDFSLKLDRFMEETASQRSSLAADHSFLSDVAREMRSHVSDSRRHANG